MNWFGSNNFFFLVLIKNKFCINLKTYTKTIFNVGFKCVLALKNQFLNFAPPEGMPWSPCMHKWYSSSLRDIHIQFFKRSWISPKLTISNIENIDNFLKSNFSYQCAGEWNLNYFMLGTNKQKYQEHMWNLKLLRKCCLT